MSMPPSETQPPEPLNYAVPVAGLACPRCGQFNTKPVHFSWWGGVVGPKMLNHTKCHSCGFTFNAKTGGSNTRGIVIYSLVLLALGIFLLVVLPWP